MIDLNITGLVEIGLKVTPQRQAILKILSGNRTHPSAETIYQEISKIFPNISFATVYNTLSKLVEAKKIQELDIDPSKKRFDPFFAPHHHFYCKICNNVFDIFYDDSEFINLNLMKTKTLKEHQVDSVQVNFKGVCNACSKSDR